MTHAATTSHVHGDRSAQRAPELFERAGFARVGPLGKKSWVYSLSLSWISY